MASLRHLVRHFLFVEDATRHASCKQCSNVLFWFNVVLIKVDTFTIFDTMGSMKGHKQETKENN